MPITNAKTFISQGEFTALVGGLGNNIGVIETDFRAQSLSVPIIDVSLYSGEDGVQVEWGGAPSAADVAALAARAALIVGGGTTSQPFVYESFSVATSNSAVPVVKIDQTTPPLDAGTYQVSWVCSTRMQAVIANTGVEAKIRLERLPGNVFVEQDDAWNLANRHAYNGSQPFQIQAGQRIRALLTFSRLGASGVAEMSGARVTIDKVGEPA